MQRVLLITLATLASAPGLSQTPPTAGVATAPASIAKYTLDTPIEALAADPRAKAVLMADLPDLLPHASYDSFKAMSLRQAQPYSQGALTDALLVKVETDLAAIK